MQPEVFHKRSGIVNIARESPELSLYIWKGRILTGSSRSKFFMLLFTKRYICRKRENYFLVQFHHLQKKQKCARRGLPPNVTRNFYA